MIKKLFTFLCLCTLCIGSAWGDDYVLDFETDSPTDWTITDVPSIATLANGTRTDNKCASFNVTTAKYIYYNKQLTNVTQVTFIGNRTSSNTTHPTISVEGSTDKSNWSELGKTTPTLAKNSWTQGTITLASPYTGYIRIKYSCTSTAVKYIDDITITTSSTPTPAKTLTSISVSGAPTKTTYFAGDTFDPAGLEITATYDTGNPEEIAYAGNESKFTFNPTLTTALQTSNTSVEITYGGKTCSQTITVNARPAFTVTLGDNSEALIEEAAGAGVTLPSRTTSNTDYTFAGWSTTNIQEETETAPTIIPAGTYHPSENITLYPVFSRTETGSGFSKYEKVTTAPSDWSGQYLLSTGTYTATGEISNNHLTRDTYNNFTTEATSREFTLAKVGDAGYSIKFGDNYLGWTDGTNFTTDTNTPTNTSTGYLWTPSTNKISNVAKNTRIIADNGSTDFRPYASPTTGIVYLYKRIEGGSTTYYTSNPAAIIVKAPTFTPADGTKFASALDVTIECETDGATIKYSTDNGETWSDYSEAINITETTTIQAKAVKETVESSVVEATYTQLAGILSMKDNGAGTYKLTDAVVTYITGNNAFIQDATSGAYLYGCKGELAVGDVINGDVTVATTEYKGLFEISTFNTEKATIANDPTKVVPTIVTITDLNANYGRYEGVYVKIEGATVTSAFSSKSATIEQNDASITLYDQFNLSLDADATAVVDVTGFLSKFNNVQFWTKEITVKSAGLKTSTIKFTTAQSTYCVDDIEEFAATAYDEKDAARTDEYTITYTSSDPSVAEVEESHILAYKEGKVTITASTVATDEFAAAEATFDITILPKGTVWFEDFTGMENTTDVKDKYVTTGTVTLYKETTSGGTAPEILLNGTFKVDLSSKDVDAGIYTLTFNSNNGADISVNGGVVISAVTDKDNAKLWSTQINVTDPSTFDITFSRTKNSRLDNFILKFDHAANTSDVTIAGTGYSSFSSTYAVNIPKGITAYYATAVEGDKVTMTEVEGGVIPANEGVIIKGEPSQEYNFTETVSDKSFYNNKLVAVSKAISGLAPEVTKADGTYKNYVFKDGQFHPFTSDATVNVGAGKAYLQIKKPADPNAKLDMSFDGGASGIETVLSTRAIDNNAIYNLRGERVNTMVKGNVYIVAGKKYLMK